VRPLDDPGTLDFGQHADQREHGPPDRRREIERPMQRHESDPKMLELVEQRYQVTEVAAVYVSTIAHPARSACSRRARS
jgi:hypothetical protein